MSPSAAIAPWPIRHASRAGPRRSRPGSRSVLWSLILLLFMLSSCAAWFAPAPGLQPTPPRSLPGFADDGEPASLDAAVEQSMLYYSRLPPETRFLYGGESYSPEEMIRSLELFRSLPVEPAQRRERLARDFLVFESVAPGGANLFTGYYEPEIAGSHEPVPGLDTPLLERPAGLVEVHLERFGDDLPRRRLAGRLEGRELVPFYDRAEIQETQALDGQAGAIAYVNEIDLFFLQIQGSGVIRFADGTALQVGYDGTNGRPYRSLGAELIRRNALTREEVTLQSIRAWLSEHPEEVRPLLYTNPSYIFFRVLDEGPLGNIQVPLTEGRSLAVDEHLFPKGGLAYVETELPDPADPSRSVPLRRFFLIQDTGGAIRGHGRADLFWGRGGQAEWKAGHLKHPGRLFILVARKEALAAASAAAD